MSVVAGQFPDGETGALDASGRLADFAGNLDYSDIPTAVLAAAKLSIADAMGIALASTRYSFAERTISATKALAGTGTATVFGQSATMPVRDAAMVNGVLVHGLDYDDTHPPSIVHPTASAWPTAFAAGEMHRATGMEVLAAYIIAVEADLRLGEVSGGFQAAGFHPTGLVGIFGAVLAAGRLAGLDGQGLVNAQGIALSMASGSMAFLDDGAWTKRLHPGWSAASAITAATLAQHEFLGPQEAYAGRYGLYQAYLKQPPPQDLASSLDGLGAQWKFLELAIKPYPVCHYIHAFADAALELKRAHQIDVNLIEQIIIHIHPDQTAVVCEPEDRKRRPAGEYDAKFSAQFVVATTLLRDQFTLEELNTDALVDAEALRLCDKVTVQKDDSLNFPQYFPGALTIRMTGGESYHQREDINRGTAARPLGESDIQAKFLSNAAPVVGQSAADEIWRSIHRIEDLTSLDALAAQLRGTQTC